MPKPPYPEIETVWVDAATIQAAFNRAGVWEKVVSGEYSIAHRRRRLRQRPASLGASIETFRFNEHVWIVDAEKRFIAHAHRFLVDLSPEQLARRPDPKRLVVGETMLALSVTLPGE